MEVIKLTMNATAEKLIRITKIIPYLWDKFLCVFYKRAMKYCGRGVYLRPSYCEIKGLNNLSIGNRTIVSKGAILYCTDAPLTIGKNVLLAPNFTAITGEHRVDVVGNYIIENVEKLPENDAPVVIEDDVWCGANVTILKGVTIGRGSVIAAGAVVTRSIPPYSIAGGVPAKVLKQRFSEDVIEEHEKLLKERKG